MKTSTAITMSVCALLIVGLAASLITINQNNQTITQQQTEIAQLKSRIDPLDTLVFHVSEKGEDYPYARLPNATDTYSQLLSLNNGAYEILLMPEYMGHQNWEEELSWIAETFGGPQGIPLMLCIAGGGENPQELTPKLTTEQIQTALEVANIKWIRIAEACSWHIEQQQTFPTDYMLDLLELAETSNLKVFWTEWKNDYPKENHETFTLIQSTIQGYEDLVTVSFSTNSNELEPADGFLKLKDMFQNWGASIQPWYWNTTKNSDLMDMPSSLLLAHAVTAKGIGAEVLQFEPYWYFFNENGQANSNLNLLLKTLT